MRSSFIDNFEFWFSILIFGSLFFGKMYSSRVGEQRSSGEPLSPRRQLTQYLEEVVEFNKAPENVFKFWKEHAILYPELSILAFQVLCVPSLLHR